MKKSIFVNEIVTYTLGSKTTTFNVRTGSDGIITATIEKFDSIPITLTAHQLKLLIDVCKDVEKTTGVQIK